MRQVNNVNENGNVSITSNYISNDNVSNRYIRERRIDEIADSLLLKFGLTNTSKGFMCNVARKLSESRIQQHYEASLKATKSQVGLFIYLCKRDGV